MLTTRHNGGSAVPSDCDHEMLNTGAQSRWRGLSAFTIAPFSLIGTARPEVRPPPLRIVSPESITSAAMIAPNRSSSGQLAGRSKGRSFCVCLSCLGSLHSDSVCLVADRRGDHV